MQRTIFLSVGGALLVGFLLAAAPAQTGPAERLGERIDRGLEQLGEQIRQTWADIRQQVDELGVRGRVYGRLRWDKALADQTIDIEMREKDVVVLIGVLPEKSMKEKAERLARDTIGVRDVVNELRVERPQETGTESPQR